MAEATILQLISFGLTKEQAAELWMRLNARQPQVRLVTQRLAAAITAEAAVQRGLDETIAKIEKAGSNVDGKTKNQFMLLRRRKDYFERAADFYGVAGRALMARSFYPFFGPKPCEAVGRRMLELGDAWEASRDNVALQDAIRLLLRELSIAITELPQLPPAEGQSQQEARDAHMQRVMTGTKIKLPAMATGAAGPAKSAKIGSAAAGAPGAAPKTAKKITPKRRFSAAPKKSNARIAAKNKN